MSKMNDTSRQTRSNDADPYRPYLEQARRERAEAFKTVFGAFGRWVAGAGRREDAETAPIHGVRAA
ncbi:MAG: hypothetical protein AAF192_15240 [Pseudomonadota bacterium]